MAIVRCAQHLAPRLGIPSAQFIERAAQGRLERRQLALFEGKRDTSGDAVNLDFAFGPERTAQAHAQSVAQRAREYLGREQRFPVGFGPQPDDDP